MADAGRKTSYQISPSLSTFAGVDNLGNQQRDFNSGTDFGPIAGRFIYLGLQLQTDFSNLRRWMKHQLKLLAFAGGDNTGRVRWCIG